MQTVGVESLKENLTDLLKKVENGEHISITSKGHKVALLIPCENRFENARKKLEELRKTAFVGDVLSPVSEDWELMQ
jgi:prevent-host-death family protein